MTTRLFPPMRYNSRHDASSEPTMPHCPQPGSPTLTNPDMILPDYNELLGYKDLPQPPRQAWKNGSGGHSVQPGFHFTDNNNNNNNNNFYVNPDPFTTPFIYGNGTMLSDIGEVTEVESNAGGLLSRNTSRRTNQSLDDVVASPLRQSQSQGQGLARAGSKPRSTTSSSIARRFSTDSTSTIGTPDRNPHPQFVDFDDNISTAGDSIFQGDDEGSTTSSYADDFTTMSHSIHIARSVSLRRSNEEAAANSMSRRAEEILANAKQRLTDMEDNLCRARTLSYSTVRKVSTTASPSPSPAKPASTYSHGSAAPTVHSRNMSENGLSNIRSGGAVYQRSASALGAAGGYRRTAAPTMTTMTTTTTTTTTTTKGMDAPRHSTERGAYTLPQRQLDLSLESLSEDDYAESITGRLGGVANAAFGIFDHGSPHSSIQVRDLKDQMNGLKGKISSLREQARADSLRRRSLQSLRTPSPFTYADWDTVFTDSRKQHSSDNDPVVAELELMHAPENRMLPPKQENFHEQRGVANHRPIVQRRALRHSLNEQSLRATMASAFGEDVTRIQEKKNEKENENEEVKMEEKSEEVMEEEAVVNDGNASQNGGAASQYENHRDEMTRLPAAAHQGYESESEESMYHDSFQHQISHEDREDAFDYEHFFLHSGNLRARSASIDSVESEDSVESNDSNDSAQTARGPAPRRRPSLETTASADSFQTATEELIATRASIVTSGYRVYMPADLHKNGRPLSIASVPESSSGSESSASLSHERRPRPCSVLHRPLSAATVSRRPSYSSFESTGTTRSFPLVNKSKRNSSVSSVTGMLTPGSSPDHGARSTRTSTSPSGLREAASILAESEGGDNISRGPSPAIQVLSPADQATVEALVAGLGKCVLVLGEPGGAATGAHELYRRRIETARLILEGELDLP